MASKTRANKRSQKRARTQRRGRRGGSFIGKTFTNVSRMNVNTIGAINAKLNTLLITLKAPYKFSDGSFANQYNLNKANFASDGNEGRGNNIYNGAVGDRTGFSGFFNSGPPRTQ